MMATYQNVAAAAMASSLVSGTPAPGATAEKLLKAIVAPSSSTPPGELVVAGTQPTKREARAIAEDDKDLEETHAPSRRKEAMAMESAAEADALNQAKD